MTIPRVTLSRLARFKEVAQKRQKGLILVLEDIADPHNAAACLRSADGLGVQEVWFVFARQKSFNPRKIGGVTSSSANKWLDYKIFKSAKDCLRELKKKKYIVAATTLHGNAQELQKAKFKDIPRLALVMGNEHSGISEEMERGADMLLKFSMRGFVESLNLSVATALFLYEIVRQRGASTKKSSLSIFEQKKLIKSFCLR